MTLPTPARVSLLGLILIGFALRGGADVHRDIHYDLSPADSLGPAQAASPARRLDIYTPTQPSVQPSKSLRPVFVYVHGGGWTGGDKSQVANKPEWLNGQDFIFVSVGYRLMPEHRHPAAAADLAAALAWLEANIADYGGDPSALFLLGHSTGGHVISLVATDERLLAAHQLEPGFIRGVICLDTNAFDLGVLIKLLRVKDRRRYFAVFGTDPQAWLDASPAHHIASGSAVPPFLLIVAGTGGSTLRLGSLFARRLETAGVAVTLSVFPGETHGSVNADLGREDHAPTAAVDGFVRRLLQSAAPLSPAR